MVTLYLSVIGIVESCISDVEQQFPRQTSPTNQVSADNRLQKTVKTTFRGVLVTGDPLCLNSLLLGCRNTHINDLYLSPLSLHPPLSLPPSSSPSTSLSFLPSS